MRAQGGGEGRERGRVERKEVRWAWMGAKGFGMRGLGFGSDVPAELLSHGNWNWEGMAMAVRRRKQGMCTGKKTSSSGVYAGVSHLLIIIFYTINDNSERLSLTGQLKEKIGCIV
jgi:hypothetical protein